MWLSVSFCDTNNVRFGRKITNKSFQFCKFELLTSDLILMHKAVKVLLRLALGIKLKKSFVINSIYHIV